MASISVHAALPLTLLFVLPLARRNYTHHIISYRGYDQPNIFEPKSGTDDETITESLAPPTDRAFNDPCRDNTVDDDDVMVGCCCWGWDGAA
jgi:hypothetical protein